MARGSLDRGGTRSRNRITTEYLEASSTEWPPATAGEIDGVEYGETTVLGAPLPAPPGARKSEPAKTADSKS